jgi:outer membrane PBP1 activator LpoA protein
MYASVGRLRIAGLTALFALAVSGCVTETGQPVAGGSFDRQMERAARLAASGQHGDSAQSYQEIAAQTQTPEYRNRAHLRAANEWTLVNDWDKATQELSQVAEQLPSADAPMHAKVAASIALHGQRPDRALAELDKVPQPWPSDSAADLLGLRARAQFASKQPAQAVATALERERLLNESDQRANRQLIWEGLQRAASSGADFSVKPGTSPVVAGWLDLNRAAIAVARNPLAASGVVSDWQRTHAGHPANAFLNEEVLPRLSAGIEYPSHLALILPLSGRQQVAGTSVRDGFLTALLQQDSGHRPNVSVYDSAALGAAAAYQQAVKEGAEFIVGPLTKEEITAIATAGGATVPTLGLNYLADNVVAPPLLFQYSLDPEEEARQVAQRASNEGHSRALVLLPRNDWGQRMLRAFDAELKVLGGTIAATRYYNPTDRDYSAAVREILLVDESNNRSKALSATLGTNLEFEPRHRDDFDFVFIGASPAQGRSLRPALRFYLPSVMPTYSTSEIFEPDGQANNDLDGVTFADMPWVISPDEVTTQLRQTLAKYWPARTRVRGGRLYAFGFDAYRLVPLLKSGRAGETFIPGLTGRLTVDDHGRVHRELDWAQIQDGQPQPRPYAGEGATARVQ